MHNFVQCNRQKQTCRSLYDYKLAKSKVNVPILQDKNIRRMQHNSKRDNNKARK